MQIMANSNDKFIKLLQIYQLHIYVYFLPVETYMIIADWLWSKNALFVVHTHESDMDAGGSK